MRDRPGGWERERQPGADSKPASVAQYEEGTLRSSLSTSFVSEQLKELGMLETCYAI